jgi:hypothetical protein
VLRVSEDGTGRDLRSGPVEGMHRVAFTPDGGIWVLGAAELFRLGHEGVFRLPGVSSTELDAGPDGTLWAIIDGEVASFRSGAWTMAPAFPGEARGVAVLPDGAVWASTGTALAHLVDGRWATVPLPRGAMTIDAGTVAGYGSSLDGGLVSSPDGSLWLRTRPGEQLLRYHGTGWETISFPADFRVTLWAAGGDGVVWAYEDAGPWADSSRTSGGCGPTRKHRVARFADGSWTVMPDRVPGIWLDQCYVGYIAVAPDGRLWATAGDRLGVHDGIAWIDVLTSMPEQDVGNLQQPVRVAPNGAVWLWGSAGIVVLDPAVGEVMDR